MISMAGFSSHEQQRKALGPDGARQFLAVPRHEITISENVAHKLRATGAAEAERLDQEES